jgi:hypothetical protein
MRPSELHAAFDILLNGLSDSITFCHGSPVDVAEQLLGAGWIPFGYENWSEE